MAARLFRTVLVFLFGVTLLCPIRPAWATAPPPNDDFDAATIISVLPFTDTLDTTGATQAADDPTACGSGNSVWYAVTPSQTEIVGANTFGSTYPIGLSVYTGVRGSLAQVACNAFSGSQAQVNFTAAAGTTYFLMVAGAFGGSGGGTLLFSVAVIPPPANDNFLSATQITSLPFQVTQDMAAASLETGEPTPSCSQGSQLAGSVWYTFTPTTSGSVSATTGSLDASVFAAYTGTSLGNLKEMGCTGEGGRLTFRASAGTTYYFQAGGIFGQTSAITFGLAVPLPPMAGFVFFPSDPSIFDVIQFIDTSSDPSLAGFTSESWAFGDGVTATGSQPTHRYATDASYTVVLTVTTVDGRMASGTQVVKVQTHDVAITKLSAPSTAKVGRTDLITASVSDSRYPETVQVQLFKSDPSSPGGFDLVGSLTQSISARAKVVATPFSFDYTFTSDDGVIGKVTFMAVATIVGARDALPADNTAIAPPTQIKPRG